MTPRVDRLSSDVVVDAVRAHDGRADHQTIKHYVGRVLGPSRAEPAIELAILGGRLIQEQVDGRRVLRLVEDPAVQLPARKPTTAAIVESLRRHCGIAYQDIIVRDVRRRLDTAGAQQAITTAARAGLVEELLLRDGAVVLRLVDLSEAAA